MWKEKLKVCLLIVDNTHEVRIKNEVSGENFDYTSADVKEIKFYGKKLKNPPTFVRYIFLFNFVIVMRQ